MSVEIDTRIVPIPEEELKESYRGVVPMQAGQAMHFRNIATRRKWLVGSLVAVAFAQAFAIAFMLPLQRVIGVFVFLDKFGVQQMVNHISELPQEKRVAGIEALIWQYVKLREHYSAAEADEDYKVVSAMSSGTVRDQYQKWANPKLSKQAPANLLGAHGLIRLYRTGGFWRSRAEDYSTGIYQVQFCRVVQKEQQPAVAQRFSETVRYQLTDSIPLWERLQLNFIGLIVTEYPGPEVESGTDAKAVPTILGENPCA